MPQIRSIQISDDYKTILVGTFGGEIWELSTKENKLSSAVRFTYYKPILRGHFHAGKQSKNEIWGLAFNPVDTDIYYTCGDDATLRVWSMTSKTMIALLHTNLDMNGVEIKPDDKGFYLDNVRGRSIAVSPDGFNIVVGFKDGAILMYDRENK